jgi:hypothetical protein
MTRKTIVILSGLGALGLFVVFWTYVIGPRLYEHIIRDVEKPGVEIQVTDTSKIHDFKVTTTPEEVITKVEKQKEASEATNPPNHSTEPSPTSGASAAEHPPRQP